MTTGIFFHKFTAAIKGAISDTKSRTDLNNTKIVVPFIDSMYLSDNMAHKLVSLTLLSAPGEFITY